MNRIKSTWLGIIGRISSKSKTTEEKLMMLAESMANELFNDTFEGKKLTSPEISFVAFHFKENVKTKLVSMAQFHSEESKLAADAANKL